MIAFALLSADRGVASDVTDLPLPVPARNASTPEYFPLVIADQRHDTVTHQPSSIDRSMAHSLHDLNDD